MGCLERVRRPPSVMYGENRLGEGDSARYLKFSASASILSLCFR